MVSVVLRDRQYGARLNRLCCQKRLLLVLCSEPPPLILKVYFASKSSVFSTTAKSLVCLVLLQLHELFYLSSFIHLPSALLSHQALFVSLVTKYS